MKAGLVLQLSTAHLPDPSPDFGGLRSVSTAYGWIVWDCKLSPDVVHVPEWLTPMIDKARELGCFALEFDCDNDVSDCFEVFQW